MIRHALLCTLAALPLAAPAHADVIVVDLLLGAGDTTDIQAGIDMAAPGDVILVRPGNFQPFSPSGPDFVVVDKPVTIIGEGHGPIIGFLHVEGIGASESVVVRNLRMSQPPLSITLADAVTVEDCAGTVLFEDCAMTGVTGENAVDPGTAGLVVTSSSGVALTRCFVFGGAGHSTTPLGPEGNGPGGDAIRVTDSKLALFHCEIVGGNGGFDNFYDFGGKPGGDGLVVADSTVFVAGGTTEGGLGSDGCPPSLAPRCVGGDGVVASGTTFLRTLGATLLGGAGGTLTDETPAPSGAAVTTEGGALHVAYGEQARGTSIPGLLREGDASSLLVTGPPGEGARLFVATGLLYAQLSGKKGVSFLGGATIGPLVLGEFDGNGELAVPFVVPDLLGFEGVTVTIQGYSSGSEGLLFANPTQAFFVADTF